MTQPKGPILMFPASSPTATRPRPNRVGPRWFALPVVVETPLPQAQAGSAW
jgi:hypothetical protein